MLKILRSPIHLNKLGLKKKKGKKGESSEELVDLVTGQTFPVVNDVPDFLSLDQEKSGNDLPASYKSSQDIRSRWKSRVRRFPLLTRFLQFIFDPACVNNSLRNKLFSHLHEDSIVLNIGSGVKQFKNVRTINLDIELYGNVNIVADGSKIPLASESVNVVILEYVIEHIADSSKIKDEIFRVITPGGFVYATVPFMQAYHGNPDDYYRFSISGFKTYWSKFECVNSEVFGGPTSALICMIKEYTSILLSFNNKTLYSILSQILILPLFPFKYIDLVLAKSPNAHNIAFSMAYLGRKVVK